MDKLTGRPQHYPWGSSHEIHDVLGTDATDEPLAEYWLGAHASAPALVGNRRLDAAIAADPAILGDASRAAFGDRLPYLLKLLAAARPLSLQAHPTRAQAEAGFAREEAAGVPIDGRERTYKDDWPKPEAIVALNDFDALCGFRDPGETARLFEALGAAEELDSILGPLTHRDGTAGMAEVFLDVLSLGTERRHLVDAVVAAAVNHIRDADPVGAFARTAVELDEFAPGDPGILAALLLNRVTLAPGEALFLRAGRMHSYLRGLGVEIMANSDNVLRGGLTSKHIDVDELVAVVDFAADEALPIERRADGPGLERYLTPAPEFALWRVDPSAAPRLPDGGARILLVTDGGLTLTCGDARLSLRQGEAALLPDGDSGVTANGTGLAFLAAPGLS